MHRLIFYPLGNADSYIVQLENGRELLFDYSNQRSADPADRRADLPTLLREHLVQQQKDRFDVFGITHLDDDHVRGASSFFHLEHAAKYQGGDRIKIQELWVPAAAITEERSDVGEDGGILQAEARYRLKQGLGIRVFSRPDALKGWLEAQGLSLESRAALITDAGKLVPGFDLRADGVEFFAHSPFAAYCDRDLIDRNTNSLVMQATFVVDGQETRFILSGDPPYDVLVDMVRMTVAHDNQARLSWDVFAIPHHCSYLSLGPEKGKDKTVPEMEVAWLFEEGRRRGILVSTSDPIPPEDTIQPPHRQAAAYYTERAGAIGGEFVVSMEHPTKIAPEPLVISIGRLGAMVEKRITPSGITVTSQSAPRAG